jgi:hypothetical protein
MKRNVTLQLLTLTIILAFVMMPFTTNAQGSKTNFAGNWAFNAEKSQMGQSQGGGGGMRGGFGGGNMVVKQDANLLTVDQTRTGQDGQSMTTTSKYTLDGKESVNSTGRGESKSTAKWSADGKSLTIVTTRTFDRNGETMEMKTSEVWSLTSPTALSVTSTMNTPNGDRTTTRVYDKK